MTVVGGGGVKITGILYKARFHKEYGKLTADMQERVDDKLQDLLKDPRPPGLAFEKLKAFRNPDVYTVHVTGNYKISMELVGNRATLRRVGNHNEIDRCP